MLDNPAWHALTGPQKTVAQLHGGVVRYDPEVAPFAALPDDPGPSEWDDLRELVGPGAVAILFVRPPSIPDGWDLLFEIDAVQMVAVSVEPAPASGVYQLGEDDIDEMLALTNRTEPGPFMRRTIELGEYIGIRDDDGSLIAMAGERMHPPDHREISAVCTDVPHRGKGLAAALVRDLVGRITDRGETAMLHVVSVNTTAIRLYDALGFTVSRHVEALGLRAPS